MSRRRRFGLPALLVAFLGSSAFGWPYPSPGPAPGTTDIPVPFHAQETNYFCVPAAMQMWRHFKWNAIASQTQIWDDMLFLGGATPNVGAKLSGVTAAGNFVGATEEGFYQTNQDRAGLRQALADQTTSIDERNPLIVATLQDTHVAVLKGLTWHRLNDALQRPNMEFVHLNDPGNPPAGQYVSYTLGEWMNIQVLIQVSPCFSYGCVYQVRGLFSSLFGRPYSRQSVANAPALSARATPRAGRADARSRPATLPAQLDETSKAATRNGTFIPHPYSTKRTEIAANVAAAIRQSHLDEAWQMPALAMRHGELMIGRILDVTSLAKRQDYYLVELINPAGGLVANIAIYKSGILIGGQRVDDPNLRRTLDLSDASARAKRFGPIKAAKYVYLIGPAEPGSSVFAPLAAVEVNDGTVFFNSRGEAFAEETSGLAKRVGVEDNQPLPAAMVKLRKLKDR